MTTDALEPETDARSAPAAPRWRLRRLALRTLFGAVLLLGLGFTAGFLLFAAGIEEEEHVPSRRAEAMIALTGGKDRIPDAVELLAEGYANRLLISGVNRSITRNEVAQLTPRFRSLVECCVELGYQARNTIGNAEEARRWFVDNKLRGPLLVVTSNYHMPRALVELSAELPNVELIPAPVVTEKLKRSAWWTDVHVARLWASEYAKFVVSLARVTFRDLRGQSRTVFAAR
jgi:uncharacterized SAM-binding protein YcdF (DUF218 family)